jgi:hypothetical protein
LLAEAPANTVVSDCPEPFYSLKGQHQTRAYCCALMIAQTRTSINVRHGYLAKKTGLVLSVFRISWLMLWQMPDDTAHHMRADVSAYPVSHVPAQMPNCWQSDEMPGRTEHLRYALILAYWQVTTFEG